MKFMNATSWDNSVTSLVVSFWETAHRMYHSIPMTENKNITVRRKENSQREDACTHQGLRALANRITLNSSTCRFLYSSRFILLLGAFKLLYVACGMVHRNSPRRNINADSSAWYGVWLPWEDWRWCRLFDAINCSSTKECVGNYNSRYKPMDMS